MPQEFIPFYGWMIFHRMDLTHLVDPFISWWTFGLFPPFDYLNSAVMNILWVAFSKWTLDFHALLLGSCCNWKHLCYLLNWLADHILGHSLNVKKLGLWRKAVDTILMMQETTVLFSKNSVDQEYKAVSSVMKDRSTLYSNQGWLQGKER